LGKSLKPRAKRRFERKAIFFLNFVLILIPVTYFGFQPLLRYAASILIVDSQPQPSDAILLLSGGEPGRAWGAADLYKKKLAPYVLVTREPIREDIQELRIAGVEVPTSLDFNLRILRSLGVPQEKIVQVQPYVEDTFDELTRVRELCEQRNWKSLLIVTSNYHTRRVQMTARYIMGSAIKVIVIPSSHGGMKVDWWKTRYDVRTFVVEFQKLVAYTLYIWPREILQLGSRLWTSQKSTNPSSTSSASPVSFSIFSS
jgi:uncharacterized SAM-binding protein YcdF (DUF218 family)